MSMKHGAYWRPDPLLKGDETSLYWMGELVEIKEFNERLMAQTKSVTKDLNMLQIGMDLKETINEGHKITAQLDELEKIAKLPLCQACRALIGEIL